MAAGFALKYPEIRLEVTTEDRPVDMVEEGYDLVIRVNPDADENLIGRIFLRDRLAVVASPGLARPVAFLDYLKEAFPTGEPEELAAYILT